MSENNRADLLRQLINADISTIEMAIFNVYLEEIERRKESDSSIAKAEKQAKGYVECLFNNWKQICPECFDDQSRAEVKLNIDTDAEGNPKPGTATFSFRIITKFHDLTKTMSYKKRENK